jgi:hypothetical protein
MCQAKKVKKNSPQKAVSCSLPSQRAHRESVALRVRQRKPRATAGFCHRLNVVEAFFKLDIQTAP